MPPALRPDADRLQAANINPITGLATDYLNHYNEVAMLIATLGDMPEMAESVLDWRPLGYAAHFIRSGFTERGLAIAGYICAPREVKEQFLAIRSDLDTRIAALQQDIAASPDGVVRAAREADAVFAEIARLGGVINGGKKAPLVKQSAAQDLVDSLFP